MPDRPSVPLHSAIDAPDYPECAEQIKDDEIRALKKSMRAMLGLTARMIAAVHTALNAMDRSVRDDAEEEIKSLNEHMRDLARYAGALTK